MRADDRVNVSFSIALGFPYLLFTNSVHAETLSGLGECGFSKTAGYFRRVSVSNQTFSFEAEVMRFGKFIVFG